jgi:DNA-binding CsgD family transcriptional regulator
VQLGLNTEMCKIGYVQLSRNTYLSSLKIRKIAKRSQTTPMSVRVELLNLKSQGYSLREISELLPLAYGTVRQLWQKHQAKQVQDCAPTYCKTGGKTWYAAEIHEKALLLKGQYPKWGTPRLHLKLQEWYEADGLPSVRTLHMWYHQSHLIRPRAKAAIVRIGHAQKVHNIWQVDAKEHISLTSEKQACYLTMVDEKSGGCLATPVFPLRLHRSSTLA